MVQMLIWPTKEKPGPIFGADGYVLARMPMLPILFDAIGEHMIEALRPLSETISFCGCKLTSGTAQSVLDAIEPRALAGLYWNGVWDEHLLVFLHSDFVFAMVELMLGGTNKSTIVIERALSPTEIKLSTPLFGMIEPSLEQGFALLAPHVFRFDGPEPKRERLEIPRPTQPAIGANIELSINGRTASLSFLLPHSAVTQLRPHLIRELEASPQKNDSQWQARFSAEVQKTEIEVQAILTDHSHTLETIASLEVGDMLALDVSMEHGLTLCAHAQDLFACQLGQSGGKYTLRLSEQVSDSSDIISLVTGSKEIKES